MSLAATRAEATSSSAPRDLSSLNRQYCSSVFSSSQSRLDSPKLAAVPSFHSAEWVCRREYCADLPNPRPAECFGGSDTLSPGAHEKDWQDLYTAIVAFDYGIPLDEARRILPVVRTRPRPILDVEVTISAVERTIAVGGRTWPLDKPLDAEPWKARFREAIPSCKGARIVVEGHVPYADLLAVLHQLGQTGCLASELVAKQ